MSNTQDKEENWENLKRMIYHFDGTGHYLPEADNCEKCKKAHEEMEKEFADNTESWIERFNEKIKDYIVKIQVGQYDENNVNIGFLPAEQIVKSFISSEREKVRQEIVEAVKKIPTGNHKRADMRDDVLKVINK